MAVEGALRTEEVGGPVDVIIGDSEDSIVGSLIITLGSDLSLFRFLPLSVVDDRSVVVGSMICMPLSSYLERVWEDGEMMKHIPSRNIVICLPKTNWLINRMESRKVAVWRASTG